MTRIGRVARLRRYPVKSMMGEDIDRAILDTYGFAGDRIYAFIDEERKKETKFPWGWITARNIPEFLLFEPKYEDKKLEFLSDNKVMTPDEIVSLLATKYSINASLKLDPKGNHDSKPVSLIGL